MHVLLRLHACTPAARGGGPRAFRQQADGWRPALHSRMSLQPGSTSAEPKTARASSSPPSPSSPLLSPARSLRPRQPARSAHCRRWRRRSQRRGQAPGTGDEARRLGAGCHDGTVLLAARRPPVDATLAHDGRTRRGRPRSAAVDHSENGWGDNKSTDPAFCRGSFRKVGQTRHTALTFRSIATVGPSALGLSGARNAERSF